MNTQQQTDTTAADAPEAPQSEGEVKSTIYHGKGLPTDRFMDAQQKILWYASQMEGLLSHSDRRKWAEQMIRENVRFLEQQSAIAEAQRDELLAAVKLAQVQVFKLVGSENEAYQGLRAAIAKCQKGGQ
jgi:hypothetical protein